MLNLNKYFTTSTLSRNSILYYFIFFFVLSLFSTVFFLSLFKVINYWSFSQGHSNYFNGFLKRGLFGTIIIYFEEITSISTRKLFSFFFILLTTANIILFFKILRKYINNYLLFIFLALNPTLIMFSFNDLGGYQRFEAISVFLILFHTYVVGTLNGKKDQKKYYKKNLYYIILPLFSISLFIHEGQAFSFFFHLFLTYRVLKKNILDYSYYLILIILIAFVYLTPNSKLAILSLENLANSRDLWLDAMYYAVGANTGLIGNYIEFKQNFLNLYNFKINFFFILIAIFPIIILFYYKIVLSNFLNIIIIFIIISPYFLFFFIGDIGRWISVMSFQALGIFYQYNLDSKASKIFHSTSKIKLTGMVIVIFILSFFIRMPHCCDLEKKGITIWGGVSSKIFAFYKVLNKDNSSFYNINIRFKD
jgi:hypothetical protein